MLTLRKTSRESKVFDVDCSADLLPTETISSVTSVSALPTTSPALAFGAPAINASQTTYTDPDTGLTRTVAAGKVIQVQISGGAIPDGLEEQTYTVHALFATNINPAVEAIVALSVNDTPPQ